ncbi:hypothetical protein BDF20DRAFT_999897 [Mycotypha africana]|uniref:uncharacterized protein n=1 Tax=Mycotypha africana TaxID=64632 RepID=UPI0023015E88|nr:uncharacterized protein BDF20DRAFT_999897 [Mycotypha africana]KAI8981805.1 hypothetical protein BDF20DRAFT_999897 [Mycotypha africana]
MFRSTIFASAIFAVIAIVSAAPGGDHHHDDKWKHKNVNTGGDAGLININPGKHLLIDDIKVDHSLNHVIDLDLIKLEEVLKNIDILSGNNAHNDEGHHHAYDYHEEYEHHEDHDDDDDHDDHHDHHGDHDNDD